MYQTSNDVRHADSTAREAVRLCVLVAIFGLGFLVVASVWVSTCGGSTADTVACGAPQRTLLALGAPAILFVGGVRAFVRTYQNWRTHQSWWAWQGAGWFLMSMMLVVLTTSVSPLVGT